MPFVRITVMSPHLTSDQIKRLRQGATQLMLSVMRKPLAGIAVLVEHVESGEWSIAGEPVPVAAHVDAIIGIGTNTAREKADFVAGMMELLRSVLGDALREETYVACHEMQVTSYGRGGLTRAERVARSQAVIA